jgi:hypothetical protein
MYRPSPSKRIRVGCVSRLVFEGPRNKLQAKVFGMKLGQKGHPSDLGNRRARVHQEAPPQLNEGVVVSGQRRGRCSTRGRPNGE